MEIINPKHIAIIMDGNGRWAQAKGLPRTLGHKKGMDCVRSTVNLCGVPGEVYNIGNPTPEISIDELVINIEKVLGRKIPCDIVDYPDSYPADEPMRRCPDIRKANLQLKYSPEVSLEEGLRRFFDWSDGIYTGNM